MRRVLVIKVALLTSLALALGSSLVQRPVAIAAPAANPAQGLAAPAGAPLMFIANAGQFDAQARFTVQGSNAAMFLADDALWLTLIDELSQPPKHDSSSSVASPGAGPNPDDARAPRPFVRGTNIKLSFVGASRRPAIEPFQQVETTVSYLRGAPEQWRSNVPVYAGVRYRNLYPGVDLELDGRSGRLEQRLRVQPGANLAAVQLRVEGAAVQAITGNTVELAAGSSALALPLFQLEIAAGFAPSAIALPKIAGQTISAPFVRALDPGAAEIAQTASSLIYSTFVGGSFDDVARSATTAGNGATFITGETFSPDFPRTAGAFDTGCGTQPNCDADGNFYYWDSFVVKINPQGSGLSYATFLGGRHNDGGYDIAVDASGAAYVTGYTISSDFPITNTVTGSSFDDSCGTDGQCNFDGTFYYYDGFLAKLNPAGSALIYSTYFGGANGDWGNAIGLNSNNEAYITGRTYAPDFPTSSGAFDTTCGTDGNCDFFNNTLFYDAFAMRFDSECTCPIYSTFLGGQNVETGAAIAVDSAGAAYITGNTASDDFPTSNGFDDACGTDGQCDPENNLVYFDGFAVKLTPDGTDLTYGTYFGGSNGDGGNGIAVGPNGGAFITGYTYSSSGFPTTSGAFDRNHDGLIDGFALKLAPNGSSVAYGTFLGGDQDDVGRAIAVDSSGNAYVVGQTAGDFPVTVNAFNGFYSGATDAFAIKLNANASRPIYSSYLGGTSGDVAFGVSIGPAGTLYLAGITSSKDFPTTKGAYDRSYAEVTCGVAPNDYQCADSFVTRLNPGSAVFNPVVNAFVPAGLQNARIGSGVVPPQLCDIYEPSDSRYTNQKKITLAVPLKAKFCRNDTEDNYYFDLSANTRITITLDIPPALKGKTVFYVYNQSQTTPFKLPVSGCANGSLDPTKTRLTASCGILGPDRYVVRLYTNNSATDYDNANQYTLLVASQ